VFIRENPLPPSLDGGLNDSRKPTTDSRLLYPFLQLTFRSAALKSSLRIFVVLILAALPLVAATERGVVIREAVLYVSPDTTSQKLANIDRGREMAVLERTHGFVHVFATVEQTFGSDRDISGWIQDRGLITSATPKGDQIVYGEAVDSENEASRAHGRKNAALDAMRLYHRVWDYFPNSPLAAEALYRSADIRWQLDKADSNRRPSAHKMDPHDRLPIGEEQMKEVMKKFPRTKWADLAAFHLIDNKLCGDWAAQSKCPEKEADIYENYVKDHPQSPAVAEALYDAATRYAALIEIYKTEGEANKSGSASQRAIATAQRIATAPNVTPDWAARAERLIYMVQNNIPTFGNAVE
jgi:hypothetical protein